MVSLILALLVGLGLMIGIMNYSSQVGTGTNQLLFVLGKALYDATYMFFTYIVLATPLLALILPLYLYYQRDDEITTKALIFSGGYGIAIYYLVLSTGFYQYLTNYFISNYHASFLGVMGLRELSYLIWSYINGFYGFLIDNKIVQKIKKVIRRIRGQDE